MERWDSRARSPIQRVCRPSTCPRAPVWRAPAGTEGPSTASVSAELPGRRLAVATVGPRLQGLGVQPRPYRGPHGGPGRGRAGQEEQGGGEGPEP